MDWWDEVGLEEYVANSGDFVASGSGFPAGLAVELVCDDASSQCWLHLTGTVEAVGAYTLTIGGYEDVAPDGEGPGYQAYPLQWSLPITVGPALAETGVSNPWIGYAAGGLIVSGAAMVLYSRRLTK